MSEEKIAKKQVADHRPLHEVVFVILDLETSGAAPSTGAGITEIGAVKVRGGEIIGEFQTFVNPQHGLSDFITSLTGITDDMLADAPKIKSAKPSPLMSPALLTDSPSQSLEHWPLITKPPEPAATALRLIAVEPVWP